MLRYSPPDGSTIRQVPVGPSAAAILGCHSLARAPDPSSDREAATWNKCSTGEIRQTRGWFRALDVRGRLRPAYVRCMNSHISRRAAARLIGVQPSTLQAWSAAGVGPFAWRRRYDIERVHAWIAEVAFALDQVDGWEGDSPHRSRWRLGDEAAVADA